MGNLYQTHSDLSLQTGAHLVRVLNPWWLVWSRDFFWWNFACACAQTRVPAYRGCFAAFAYFSRVKVVFGLGNNNRERFILTKVKLTSNKKTWFISRILQVSEKPFTCNHIPQKHTRYVISGNLLFLASWYYLYSFETQFLLTSGLAEMLDVKFWNNVRIPLHGSLWKYLSWRGHRRHFVNICRLSFLSRFLNREMHDFKNF